MTHGLTSTHGKSCNSPVGRIGNRAKLAINHWDTFVYHYLTKNGFGTGFAIRSIFLGFICNSCYPSR